MPTFSLVISPPLLSVRLQPDYDAPLPLTINCEPVASVVNSGFDPLAAWPHHGFTAPSASGRAGSRTGLPHCAPLRYGRADEARDWLRLPESRGFPEIVERLSPLFLRRSPSSTRSSSPSGVDQDRPDPKSEAKRS